LEAIMRAGERGNWVAYAWILERCWPSLFALRNVARADSEQDQESEPELPAELLQRHRALLLELAREDEARQAANKIPELPAAQEAQAAL
jgi:hypothetical protein